MEELLQRLQHASLGKKELFDVLMNLDLNTLQPTTLPAQKEEKIYNQDATLMETIVIHPMMEIKQEPPKVVTPPPALEAEAEPEIIEQLIFYSDTPYTQPITIVGPAPAPAPTPTPAPTPPSEPLPPVEEPVNIMESLFKLKKTSSAPPFMISAVPVKPEESEDKNETIYTCTACQRTFKRQHLLSHHLELTLACSQQLEQKGIHQLVHDCLNRAVKEDDKQECMYCQVPLPTKESQRAHFQSSLSCNRQALDAFKRMVANL
jgi:hypothetical protein